ncbi:hypothetical protein TYRP_023330 [Tyrophagus putrescentiae]|nr:hypothetical protein TYRP_023330 [Tyrophagus putrescentiae]
MSCVKAAASLLLSEHDILSVVAALVNVLDVLGSVRPPAGGVAAALPPAVVRLQAAVHREDVVLQLALLQARRAVRTLHPGGGVFGRNVGGAVGAQVVLGGEPLGRGGGSSGSSGGRAAHLPLGSLDLPITDPRARALVRFAREPSSADVSW